MEKDGYGTCINLEIIEVQFNNIFITYKKDVDYGSDTDKDDDVNDDGDDIPSLV